MLNKHISSNALTIDVYGREGVVDAKLVLETEAELHPTIIVKVHWAVEADLNGGDRVMSCMFAHSLIRLIAVLTQDPDHRDGINNSTTELLLHGIEAYAFENIPALVHWIYEHMPSKVIDYCADEPSLPDNAAPLNEQNPDWRLSA